MDYQITTLSAAVLGLLLATLSWRVITARQASEKGNGEELLQRRIRGQANLTEYAPISLILIFLAEHGGAPTWWVAVLAALFVFARLIHGYAFGFMSFWGFGRIGGTAMTLGALILLGLTNLWLVVA